MATSFLRKAEFKFWQLSEGRAIFEFQSFYLMRHLLRLLPRGDGNPVIVFPGFVASDISTRPMRSLLDDLGHKTYGWGLGRNLMLDHAREKQMRNLLRNVHQREGRKVSLVGWSLGGLFARELAKLDPDHVRCVVTLGSPISGNAKHSNATNMFRAVNGEPRIAKRRRRGDFGFPPPVPTTSIYSRTDGIVRWEGSLQRQVPGMQTENIEVPASHLGIGVNPIVMLALADRLAQAEGAWRPFDRSGLKRLLFRDRQQPWTEAFGEFLS